MFIKKIKSLILNIKKIKYPLKKIFPFILNFMERHKILILRIVKRIIILFIGSFFTFFCFKFALFTLTYKIYNYVDEQVRCPCEEQKLHGDFGTKGIPFFSTFYLKRMLKIYALVPLFYDSCKCQCTYCVTFMNVRTVTKILGISYLFIGLSFFFTGTSKDDLEIPDDLSQQEKMSTYDKTEVDKSLDKPLDIPANTSLERAREIEYKDHIEKITKTSYYNEDQLINKHILVEEIKKYSALATVNNKNFLEDHFERINEQFYTNIEDIIKERKSSSVSSVSSVSSLDSLDSNKQLSISENETFKNELPSIVEIEIPVVENNNKNELPILSSSPEIEKQNLLFTNENDNTIQEFGRPRIQNESPYPVEIPVFENNEPFQNIVIEKIDINALPRQTDKIFNSPDNVVVELVRSGSPVNPALNPEIKPIDL